MNGDDAPARPITRTPRLLSAAGIGVVAGFLAGLFGVGGGTLIVPGLVLLMGMEERLAHGTSLAAIVPIAVAGAAGFAFKRSVDWPAGALLIVGGAVGAVLGTRILAILSRRLLRGAFALFLLLTAARLLIEIPEPSGRGEIGLALGLALVGVGLLAGVVAGLLGVGGGIVMVPALVLLVSMPDPLAKGTSLLVIIPTALAGTVQNVRNGNAHLRSAAVLGLFGVAAAFGASQVSVLLDPRVSSALFAGLLVVVAAQLLVSSRA